MVVELLFILDCGLNIVTTISLLKKIKTNRKKDPSKEAFEKAIEEINTKYKGEYLDVLDEISSKSEKYFNNTEFTNKKTFCDILVKEDVYKTVASELYDIINQKYVEIIKESIKKDPKLFQEYVVDEMEKSKIVIKLTKEAIYRTEEKVDELKKIKILTIIDFLKVGECNKPEFFRSAGPKWIDFEKGFIIERKEVNEIIGKLNNKVPRPEGRGYSEVG